MEVKNIRSRQDSNLCGETPLDFESNALTTRPRLQICSSVIVEEIQFVIVYNFCFNTFSWDKDLS